MFDVGSRADADDSRPLSGLRSLWEMVANFSVGATAEVINELDTLITMARHNRDHESVLGPLGPGVDAKNDEAVKQAVQAIDWIIGAVRSASDLMTSGHLQNAVGRLGAWTRGDGDSWDQLFTRACALRDALRIELGEHLFYIYPKAKGQKHKDWVGDWKEISDAFPESRVESYNATDCYALGHNTASVFHAMRVAEIGLRALAKEQRVKLPKNKPIDWANWQEIIKAIDGKITEIGVTWKAGKRKDAALEFYSGARADLNGFKDEFRNRVMHVRVQYDEFQAARALARVHDFMARLAQKIDDRHHRIKWGRAS